MSDRSPLAMALGLGILLAACGSDDESAAAAPGPAPSADTGGEVTPDAGGGETPAPAPAGACLFVHPATQAPACRAFAAGAGDADTCAALGAGQPVRWLTGESCPALQGGGACTLGDGNVLAMEAASRVQCRQAEDACTGVEGGSWQADARCLQADLQGGAVGRGVFVPPSFTCSEDPAVAGETVCTWNLISGCTEPGQRYAEQGDCDAVRTQRPFSVFTYNFEADPEDPRLQDEAFQAELAWVTDQVETCACVCCHSTEAGPGGGASGWYLEASAIWTDSVPDDGLAILAGLADSSAFGAFAPEDNFGFSRDVTGLPTNDPARMQAFFLQEWLRRGLDVEGAASIPPFGGPLVGQALFEPGACVPGIGVAADGSIDWGATPIRYLYVLEAGSANPGVPPNRDTPSGTLWRIDVAPDAEALEAPVQWGVVPDGAVQRMPLGAAPAPLTPGESYYLYALFDVGFPIQRCLFTMP
jgi:hypothetical protein